MLLRQPADGETAWRPPVVTAGGAGRLLMSILGALGLATALAEGDGLRFESQRIEIRVGPDQREAEARFAFINDGDGPARFESVQTDCTCLEARTPKGEIPAGGRGVVGVKFRVGHLRGVVEKHLWVKVRGAAGSRRIRLDTVLVVPEVVRVEPRTLSWTTGGELAEQSFRVRMSGPEKVRLLEVGSSRPDFEFRVETIATGRDYLVHAKPLAVDGPSIALVNFTTDSRHRNGRTAVGFVHVRRRTDQQSPYE